MSGFEAGLCRSAPWRVLARHVVLPWALQGFRPQGQVLEIGAGSGAMAAGLLAAFPGVTMTVTDFDPAMADTAAGRLAAFGDRAVCRQADATALPFDDGSFDAVLSWVMLHHTVAWEKAVTEAIRVLRPGGRLVGYDLLLTAPVRLLHRIEGAPFRLMRLAEFRDLLKGLPVDQASVTPSLGPLAVRFTLRKTR